MKNILMGLLCLGLMGCGVHRTTSPEVQSKTPTVVPQVEDRAVGNDFWSMQIPSTWIPISLDDTSTSFVSDNKKELVVVLEEDFPGTLSEYSQISIQQISAQGVNFLNLKKISINGTDFILSSFDRETTINYLWMSVKSGKGFGFICGGQASETDLQEVCNNMANTILLK